MTPCACFITGTDTGVGKTLTAVALLAAARERGLTTLGLKPVAAGGALVDGVFQNDDARLLQQTATSTIDYAAVNPVALREAIAPHIAAAQEGRNLDVGELASHCHRQQEKTAADFTVAEGAGGWLVPLQSPETLADLAVAIGWPVVLVVAMKLGCLNHALLTAAAIRDTGLELAGWVATSLGSPMPAYAENLATLDERLGAPRLGELPYLGPRPLPEEAGRRLDLGPLVAAVA